MSEPIETPFDPVPALAAELNLPRTSVSAVVKLLAESSTVPFIARYRKEATGGLDEVQIRAIEERRSYLVEMEARRTAITSEISSQGKLSPELAKKLASATTKSELEDLYLPFKPKRRTRATIAKERGLEPLADLIWAQAREGSPSASAQPFVNAEKDVPDVSAALAGARDICAERIAEDPEIRKHTREAYVQGGSIRVGKTKDFEDKTTKFDSYAEFQEPIAKIPSHRYLAIRRGETEGVLRASLDVDQSNVVPFVEKHVKLDSASPWASEPMRRRVLRRVMQRLRRSWPPAARLPISAFCRETCGGMVPLQPHPPAPIRPQSTARSLPATPSISRMGYSSPPATIRPGAIRPGGARGYSRAARSATPW